MRRPFFFTEVKNNEYSQSYEKISKKVWLLAINRGTWFFLRANFQKIFLKSSYLRVFSFFFRRMWCLRTQNCPLNRCNKYLRRKKIYSPPVPLPLCDTEVVSWKFRNTHTDTPFGAEIQKRKAPDTFHKVLRVIGHPQRLLSTKKKRNTPSYGEFRKILFAKFCA